jgi:hypothetical protein
MTFTVFSPEEMRAMYEKAPNKRECLCVLADCSCATVREVKKVLGLIPNRKPKAKLVYEGPRKNGKPRLIDPEEIYKRLDAGMSLRQIGEEFGVSHQAIFYIKQRREVH